MISSGAKKILYLQDISLVGPCIL